jgi:hypothetical protein
VPDSMTTISPFATPMPVGQPGAAAAPGAEAWTGRALESPFGTGYTRELDHTEAGELSEVAAELLEQLDDEDFTDALEALLDGAAEQHAADLVSWSGVPSPAQALSMLEGWVEPLALAAERAVDGLAERVAGVDIGALSEEELDTLLEGALLEVPAGEEMFEQFLGKLLKKAKGLVKGAVAVARKGIAAVGKLMPINLLLGKLKDLVRPLLDRVLRAAIGKLPASVQPIARTVAAKLGLPVPADAAAGAAATAPAAADAASEEDAVTRLAAEFDIQTTGLLLAPEVVGEYSTYEDLGTDPVAELDDARARLAEELVDLPPGSDPAREIEQFIPAVMAVKPLIKLGISMIGRDRVIGFIADRIAGLIGGFVGADAAKQLARPLVDIGMRAIGFEAGGNPAVLAGEALASTVEGTVLRLLELPTEAFADELRLDAAVQSAFAEAAAAFVPGQFLRQDLPERETAGEGGVWVLLPRAARPRYRYRRYTRVYAVPITRQVARAVPWSDGGTMESYLLDRGVERWPVAAEVDLYETLPGTQLGHLAQGEAAPNAEGGAPQFQPLSPEIAGLLLREPGLGRAVPSRGFGQPGHGRGGRHGRPVAGRRFFRVRPVGIAGPVTAVVARPRRAVAVWITLSGANPSVRVALRLTERQGQDMLAKLAPGRGGAKDLPGALAALTTHFGAALPAAVVGRLLRTKVVPDAAQAGPIADRVATAVSAAVSGFLTQRDHALAAAARDPANGLTITVTFAGVTRQALDGTLPAGQVSVSPGWSRRG